eukprot:gb/GFBE01059674.1/.p1 GENE.gb/GFBE01059674.1/~~gb/GFBE01059674.1/.p1  ORF type:complete len:508 (+),score=78.52 gb/GFBE01059674.1/:1-1524(+)
MRSMRSPRAAARLERTPVDSDDSSETANSDGFFDRIAIIADGVFGEHRTDCLHFYKVPRMVKIRAAPLQIPKFVFEVLAASGALFWLVWNLHFLEPTLIVSESSVIDLSFPQKNFDVCHDPDVDCDDVGPQQKGTPPYCQNQTWPGLEDDTLNYFFTDHHGEVNHEYSRARWSEIPSVEIGCRRFDVHDIYKSHTGGPLLATAVTSIAQEQCSSSDCIWKNRDFKLDYVYDAERFLLKVRHHVQTENRARFKNLEGTAFIDIGGETRVIRCSKAKEASGACRYDVQAWKRDYPSCSREEKECFSTGFADFISLQTLLEAANISMDDGISGGLPRRWWGTAVELDIEYSNSNPYDFWFNWPWNTHLTYTYTARKMGDYVWQSEVNHANGNKRTLVRHSGINLFVSVHGKLAQFNAAYFLKVFAIFSVIVNLSKQFVDSFVLFLYSHLPFFKHLPGIHRFYQYEETPHHHDIKRLDADGLAALELKIRENTLKSLKAEKGESTDEETPG